LEFEFFVCDREAGTERGVATLAVVERLDLLEYRGLQLELRGSAAKVTELPEEADPPHEAIPELARGGHTVLGEGDRTGSAGTHPTQARGSSPVR
jgi:hypothetical protein